MEEIRCPECGKMMTYSYADFGMLHCGNCNIYIPKGPYCYRSKKIIGEQMIVEPCKYYLSPNTCTLLGIVDDVLLTDHCKVCGTW